MKSITQLAVLGTLFFSLVFLTPGLRAQSSAGFSIRFDGVNDYVRQLAFGGFVPTNEVTIEFWMRPEERRNQYLFTLVPDETTNSLSLFGPRTGDLLTWEFGDVAVDSVTSSSGITLSNWQHVAVVAGFADDRIRDRILRIYLNGTSMEESRMAGEFTRGAYQFQIGGSSATGEYFKGQLDEFRVWGVARSEEEILLTMNHTVNPQHPDLVAYYRMDEVSGTVVNDGTRNNLAAQLLGSAARTPSGAPIDDTVVATLDPDNIATTSANLPGSVTPTGWRHGRGLSMGLAMLSIRRPRRPTSVRDPVRCC